MNPTFIESDFTGQPDLSQGLGLDGVESKRLWPETRTAIENLGYEIGRELGHGGSAVTLAATAKHNGQRVAIKVIANPHDSKMLALFNHEARILASEHVPTDILPHLIQSRGHDSKSYQPFLVMELIQGQTIDDFVTSCQPNFDRILDIVEKTFWSFQRLHGCNLAHGDPSPKNVLVQPGDRIRLVDLAGARRLQSGYTFIHNPGAIGGTVGYTPETKLLGEDRASVQTDLYGVGAIAYKIFVGETPDPSRDGEQGIVRELKSKQVPDAIARIIARCLRIRDKKLPIEGDTRLYTSSQAVIDDIVAWRKNRARNRSFLRQVCVLCAIAIPLLVFSMWAYSQYQSALQSQNQAVAGALEHDVQSINSSHPAVRAAIERCQRLKEELRQLLVSGDSPESRSTLNKLIQEYRSTLELSRGLDQYTSLRASLGIVLNEMPWVTSAPAIAKARTAIAEIYQSLGERLDRGDMSQVAEDMVALQKKLAELAQSNVAAASAEQAGRKFVSEQQGVADRVRKETGYQGINTLAASAREAWLAGDFQQSTTLFGQAKQRLVELLPKLETEEERTKRTSEQTGRLQDELANIKKSYDIAEQERTTNQNRIHELENQIAQVTKQGADDREAKVNLQTTVQASQTQISKLETEVIQWKKDANELREPAKQLATLKPALEQVVKERDELKRKLEPIQRKLAILEAGAGKSTSSEWMDSTSSVAELQKQIDAVDHGDVDAARAVLEKAVTAFDVAQANRKDQLVQYAENSPTIKRLDVVIAQNLDLIRTAFETRERAEQKLYDQFEQQIVTKQKERQRLLDEDGFLATANPVTVLDREIAQIRNTQKPLAVAHARRAGLPSNFDLMKAVRETYPESPGELSAKASRKPGQRLELEIRGTKAEFHWCPEGKFKMGSPAQEEGHSSNEDQVTVTLTKGYYLLETEAAQGLWAAVMGVTPETNYGKGEHFPVYNVDHSKCEEFCKRMTEILHQSNSIPKDWRIHLPTEAQWEWAARASTDASRVTRFCFGDDESKLGEYAWYDKNASKTNHPVASKKPNAWGLYDMHGSVWEWTADWYDSELAGGNDPTGPKTGTLRVDRGGSWDYAPVDCRSADRNFA